MKSSIATKSITQPFIIRGVFILALFAGFTAKSFAQPIPEFYGLYAVDGGVLHELKKADQITVELTSNMKFILYSKNVGPLSESLSLKRRLYVRNFITSGSKIEKKQWVIGGNDAEVGFRSKPVNGQTDMVYLVPRKPLSAGVYSFMLSRESKGTFYVEKGSFMADVENSEQCVDVPAANGLAVAYGDYSMSNAIPCSRSRSIPKTKATNSGKFKSTPSQQAPRRDLPKFARTYAAPFEETWSSVLKVFEIFGDAIAEVDKSNGVIKTEPSRRDVNWLMKYWVEYNIYVKDIENGETAVELEAEILYRKKDGALKTGSLKAAAKTMKTSADAFFSELDNQQSSKHGGSDRAKRTTVLSNQAEPVAKDSFHVLTDKSSIAMIQQKLTELGYKPGQADGVTGAKTRVAISSYQRDHGLSADGLPTQALLDVLTNPPESPTTEEVSPVNKTFNALGSIFKKVVERAKTGVAASPPDGGEPSVP